jgi:hypothetical protein
MTFRRIDELETPDFDGKPFTTGELRDDDRSRAPGWAVLVTLLLVVVGVYAWRAGSWMAAVVLLGLATGLFVLACLTIRKELRRYMEYRHRI